jgi:tetratricopeptide (TPR) repeat protein
MSHSSNKKDEYYAEGLQLQQLNMIGLAIKSFKKCVECEDDNSHKACYELSKIYTKLQDFDVAKEYCVKAMSIKSNYMEALYFIAHILNLLKTPIDELKKGIESFFYDGTIDYAVMSHLFYMEGLFETALEYISKYEKEKGFSDGIKFLKVKCLIRTSRYEECIKCINTIPENSLYFLNTMMYKMLCLIVTSKYDLIWRILNKLNLRSLGRYNKKVLSVCTQFYNIVLDNPTCILCEDENDLDYTACIFEICDILLVTKEFYYFDKALGLLNLISDKSVLLQLGKLYYKYGYLDLAKKEIIRSIKLFGVIDINALDILSQSKYLNRTT